MKPMSSYPKHNKETFQLLHLSDDSKSLSDLELPEIINQRKRKVRRKTRPRPPVSNRYQEASNQSQCNRLIVWIAIFLSSCWLLTLSYMMAVIHAENVRLEVQINKQPSQVNVPLRSGGKKMRKRRELDALVAHSLAKRANKKANAGNGVNSQDQLLSPSTDEQEDFGWPKVVRNTSRTRNRKFSFIRLCGPLIFVTCISLSLGFMYWLYFDLRQQLYDYRQKIEEASVTSQNLQQALQKWHEISKNLEKNQTDMYGKILELRRNLDNLSSDYSQYKEKYMNEKKDYSKDEKIVADFGAKLASIDGDVDTLKERFDVIQKDQTSLKDSLKDLKSNFSDTINRTSVFNNTNNTNCTEEILKTKKVFLEQVQQLSNNLSSVNDILNQKTKDLDQEIKANHKDLENLTETSFNTTSHVQSIEGDWIKYKTKIVELENSTNYLNNVINQVQQDCNKYAQAFAIKLEEASASSKMESNKNINQNQTPDTSKQLNLPDPIAKEKSEPSKVKVEEPKPSESLPQSQPQESQRSQENPINNQTQQINSTTESSVAGKPKTLSFTQFTKQFQ